MNAPARLEPASALVAEALERLAAVARTAGHADVPPHLPICASRLEEAVALAGVDRGEALVVALLLAVECDAALARLVAALQAPVGGARVLAGLAASLFAADGVTVAALWGCRAVDAGLVTWGEEAAPLPERSVSMPSWIASALAGFAPLPPGVAELSEPLVELPPSAHEAAVVHALMLGRDDRPLLVIRTPCPAEGEAMARAFAAPAGLDPCALGDPPAPGLSIWLSVMKRIPLIHRNAGPGETIDLGPFDSLDSPLIVIAGQHGQLASVRTRTEWRAQIPTEAERSKLWSGWGLGSAEAGSAALRYRHGSGRIAEIGRGLAVSGSRSLEAIAAAMMSGSGKIDALARRSCSSVKREDIVLPLSLGEGLDRLRDRILLRNRLQDGLGPTIASSYRPGVRALFSGESGTGKTLAAQWLAREAGLPCYRVDLAALTSKWIGETEKNLSSLFDAAEHSDVLLFFDEADSLFGARTDVSDANDRHANAQTNFLLQRIEEFDGVALLATNGRSRFDPAFVRRLDAVLEFPLPDAPARRKLWDCHLGRDHRVSARRLDRLAAEIDLAGGHVRNVVLAASARARAQGRSIESADLDAAIAEEYAKLGRSAPTLPGG
jgi:hypothetical protein